MKHKAWRINGRLKYFILLAFVCLSIGACASDNKQHRFVAPQERPINMTLLSSNDAPIRTLTQFTPAGNKNAYIKDGGEIHISPGPVQSAWNEIELLELKISKTEDPSGEYFTAFPGSDIYLSSKMPNEYLVTPENIRQVLRVKGSTNYLEHNHYLHILTQRKHSTPAGEEGIPFEATLQYKNTFSRFPNINRFTFPLLTRVTGSPAGFEIRDLAPSIAFALIEYNPDVEALPNNIRLNALMTVFPVQGTPKHSSAIGFLLDMGGYVQIGIGYHFEEKGPLYMLGLTTEIFKNLGVSR